MPVLLEDRPERGILRLRLNRPEARNALNLELRNALMNALLGAQQDESVRVIIIAGSNTVFAAGADLTLLKELGPVELHKRGLHHLWEVMADFHKPIISAVKGYALGGGCELAMLSDMVVAGHSATFGLPEVRVGIMPGGGGTQRLVRLVGKHRAMRLLMTGELIKAPIADEWGLISHLVGDADVEDVALKIATTLSAGPTLALEFIKEVVLQGADLPLSAAVLLERRALQVLFDSNDKKEGMTAFAESRSPNFE